MGEARSREGRRVLIIGADGLRPDLVDPDLMPTYHGLMRRGCTFTSFHSVFPTHTRVNMTTLTTGVLPGRHGIINNTMYLAAMGEASVIDTADARQLLALEGSLAGGVVLAPTLGDRLRQRGERLAVAAASTPGASLLWNPRNPQRVLNATSDYGNADLAALHDKLGAPPTEMGRTKHQSCLWATRALIDVQLGQRENRVLTLWLTEPDASQHFYGLGSPQMKDALRLVDECVATVLEALDEKGLADETDLLLISDHGHSSVLHSGSLSEHLADARSEFDLGDLIAVADFIYSPGGEYDPATLDRLTDWLLQRSWCGLLLSTVPAISQRPGVLPLEIATGPITHDRAPLLAVSPRWSHGSNEFGVAGDVETLTSYAPLMSTHGTASPYDMRAFCVGVGPRFAAGAVIDVPCATVDIAPTVWDLLGYEPPLEDARFSGGSLVRLGQETAVMREVVDPGVTPEAASIAYVDGRRYFLGSVKVTRQ
ncbi:MAG: alkaline phosphatase family protein [Trueperaceae bacterium]|nr:alkaline phosphatase family protein [Trueperaceae bacterium]